VNGEQDAVSVQHAFPAVCTSATPVRSVPSFKMRLDLLTTAVSLALQWLPIPDGFGGLSGQDSIWRAALAQMDYTLGLLYLAGIWNIAFPGSPIHIERANYLHTTRKRDGRWVEDVDAIQFTFRHKLKAMATRKTRRGQLFLLTRTDCDPQMDTQRVHVKHKSFF
jgi:hypothetical protein